MKQRLEVARAFAVSPDMLFLDEPFGAPDSITRLTMRASLRRIWEAERKTIIFVTHDIEEAVQLADRVVVMSARPAKIQRIVEIDIPHPRDISSRRYLELRDGIFEEIGLAHKAWPAAEGLAVNLKRRILLFGLGWLGLISGLHAYLNVNWPSIFNDYLPETKRKFNVAYIPVTCHLACPVTDYISKFSKADRIRGVHGFAFRR
jgi:hypothetical protein